MLWTLWNGHFIGFDFLCVLDFLVNGLTLYFVLLFSVSPDFFCVVLHNFGLGRSPAVFLCCCLPVFFFLFLPRMFSPFGCDSYGSSHLGIHCILGTVNGSSSCQIYICTSFFFYSVSFGYLFGRTVLNMLCIGPFPDRLLHSILRIQKKSYQHSLSC